MRTTRSRGSELLALPLGLWFLAFLLMPLVFVLIHSVASRGPYGVVRFEWTSGNFLRAMDWVYVSVLWSSVRLALQTTVLCFAIGLPMAIVIATASAPVRSLLLLAVIVPFWINFVVRTYAIKAMLQGTPFEFGETAVLIGMLANYLPFMVLPLFVSLEKFDYSLLEAARDLGASRTQAFREVLLPLIRPGVITGSIFVFAPALGEFVIPDLLGGARTLLVGNLITDQFLKTRDWPFGSALSLILTLISLLCLMAWLRVSRGERIDGA